MDAQRLYEIWVQGTAMDCDPWEALDPAHQHGWQVLQYNISNAVPLNPRTYAELTARFDVVLARLNISGRRELVSRAIAAGLPPFTSAAARDQFELQVQQAVMTHLQIAKRNLILGALLLVTKGEDFPDMQNPPVELALAFGVATHVATGSGDGRTPEETGGEKAEKPLVTLQ